MKVVSPEWTLSNDRRRLRTSQCYINHLDEDLHGGLLHRSSYFRLRSVGWNVFPTHRPARVHLASLLVCPLPVLRARRTFLPYHDVLAVKVKAIKVVCMKRQTYIASHPHHD
jgi:hypothetical protein